MRCAIGLVNRVVPAGTERAEAIGLARHIASKSEAAIRIGKPAFYSQLDMELARAQDFAARVMVENMLDAEAVEGIGAFIAKRPPNWRGESAANPSVMDHERYDDGFIRGILNTVKTIAVVGVSANTARPSYFAFKYLLERGYRMIPVNPGLAGQDLLGQRVYAASPTSPSRSTWSTCPRHPYVPDMDERSRHGAAPPCAVDAARRPP